VLGTQSYYLQIEENNCEERILLLASLFLVDYLKKPKPKQKLAIRSHTIHPFIHPFIHPSYMDGFPLLTCYLTWVV
jgi:hypothetical protein